MTASIWSGFWAPFFTFCGAVLVALIANFLAEDYKRFRDGSALASALYGELKGYEIGMHMLIVSLTELQKLAAAGDSRVIPEATPKDWIFEKAVEKLGWLGPTLPRMVSETYGRIFMFRGLMLAVAQKKVDHDAPALVVHYGNMITMLRNAAEIGLLTTTELDLRSKQKYWQYLRSNWMSVI